MSLRPLPCVTASRRCGRPGVGFGLALLLAAGFAPPNAGADEENSSVAPGSAPASLAGEFGRGSVLYETLRCAACHAPDAPRESSGIPPDLSFAGSRYRASWLAAYLAHPRPRRWLDEDIRPVSRMPDYHLSPQEAADLTAFLESRRDSVRLPEEPVRVRPTNDDIAAGRDLVYQYSCRGCHVVEGHGNQIGPRLDGTGSRLQPAYVHALLLDPAAVVPETEMKKFDYWKGEARSITAYLTSLVDSTLSAAPDSTPPDK